MAATLNRQLIKQRSAAPRFERITIPEWDCDAILKVMTGTERDAYEVEITGSRFRKGAVDQVLNLQNIRARLVARCLVDEEFKPIYDYRKLEDINELGATDAMILDRLFDAARKLNGISDDDVKALEKNLPAEANGVSGTT